MGLTVASASATTAGKDLLPCRHLKEDGQGDAGVAARSLLSRSSIRAAAVWLPAYLGGQGCADSSLGHGDPPARQ